MAGRRQHAGSVLSPSSNGRGLIFHRTPRDAQLPRRVLTSALLGDPPPDRVVPEIPDAPEKGRQPAPINLTFRDSLRCWGDDVR